MRKGFTAPEASVRVFHEGQACVNALPGDMILVQHDGFAPAVIRFGQRVRYFMLRHLFRRKEFLKIYCQYNHSMIVVDGGPEATVCQMEAAGGRIVKLRDYVDRKYVVVSPTNVHDTQRLAARRFAVWCEDINYGWFSIFGDVLDVLIPVISIALASGVRMVCSTASCLAHRCMGLIPDKSDVSVMPADLARYYDVKI